MNPVGYETRDLKGYGERPPNPKWPNKAKIAVSFVVNYEEGGENTPVNGDVNSEIFLSETPGGTSRTERDLNMETLYEYGSRCGFWRILRLFDKFKFHFTCYAVGKAIELNPSVVDAMQSRGHEVASHNHRWIDYSKISPEEERQHILDCIDAITSASSRKQGPVGWYTGRVSLDSRRLVWEAYQERGLDLMYECDAYNDELPYWVSINGQGLLIIPYTLDQNDMKFCVPPGFTDPNSFFIYLKNSFDTLRAEGLEGSPKLLSIGLHCRIIGKPGRIPALAKFLEYISTFDDVWVCTRKEVAEHWRKEFPFG